VSSRLNKIQIIGLALLAAGVVLGVLLVAAITWADLEAYLFRYGLDARARIRNLNCPVVISSREMGQIKLTLKNPGEKDLSRFVRAYISDGFFSLTNYYTGQYVIPPGQEKQIAWEIFPEQAVYDRVILYRVYVHGNYKNPPMDGNCGVLVADFLGLTGRQMFVFFLGLIFFGILGGGGILYWKPLQRTHPLSTIRNGLMASTIMLAMALWVSLAGLWLFSLILLVSLLFLIINLLIQLLS
jgi:hypothetical protein